MARFNRPSRSLEVATTVTFDDVDYDVTGNVDFGTPARPFAYGGEGDPGDPGEITDIVIKNAEGVELDFDGLSRDEQEMVTQALEVAAEEEAISRTSDYDDRRYEEMRDER